MDDEQHASIVDYLDKQVYLLFTKLLLLLLLLIYIMDIKERCIMCGAGDTSLNHPDYCDCMGV